MNLLAWIGVIFVAHIALYFALGTENWISTATLATLVWAAALYGIRFFIRQRQRERT
ncbi:hypothetical protein [Ammoniphilus sp. YIM 78166]|uniref:hypothetical protein n=1 Tax=Ammoniphilus sp. YIM 78166 TaxID=1644106 RepID=UPI001431DD75|nr:hypothetical protein [Ammoniphilus sp. YIM 78166]